MSIINPDTKLEDDINSLFPQENKKDSSQSLSPRDILQCIVAGKKVRIPIDSTTVDAMANLISNLGVIKSRDNALNSSLQLNTIDKVIKHYVKDGFVTIYTEEKEEPKRYVCFVIED